MTNTVDCPHCERSFHVPPELLGKRMRCLQCQHVFVAERLEPAPTPSRRSVELATDDRPPPSRSRERFPRDTTDYSGYLWPLAALPWGLLVLALGGCIWGLLAGMAAAVLSGFALILLQSRRLSFALRLSGLLAIDGVAALLLLGGGATVIFLLSSPGKNGGNPMAGANPLQRENPKFPPAPEVSLPPVTPLFERGARVYLADLKEFGVQAGGPWPFDNRGVLGDGKAIRVNGSLSPRGLSMHPPMAPAYASVRYRLGRQAALFRALAAINDTSNWCFSPATFTVFGDGRLLWQSEGLTHTRARRQSCEVNVTGVDVLELRVQCENGNPGVHAVWVEPRLLQKADTPDQ